MKQHLIRHRDWITIIVLSLVWGSSYILMKKGMHAFSPVQVACLRVTLTGIVLLPFAIIGFRQLTRRQFGFILLTGLLGNALPPFCFTIAQTHVDSSVAGILNTTTPIFTLLVSIFIFKLKVKRYTYLGITLGFIGSASLIIFQKGNIFNHASIYAWLIIVATLMYGLSVNIMKANLQHVNPSTITAVIFVFFGSITGSILFSTDFISRLTTSPEGWQSFGYVAILAVAGTAFAMLLYMRLLQRTTPIFAATPTYLMPIVALGWGLTAGESIGLIHFGGMALILFGVWLVSK